METDDAQVAGDRGQQGILQALQGTPPSPELDSDVEGKMHCPAHRTPGCVLKAGAGASQLAKLGIVRCLPTAPTQAIAPSTLCKD